MLVIQDAKTRSDCVRDNRAIICKNARFMGFSSNVCKSGYWLTYEIDNHYWIGRAICRVTCENKIYIEIAQLSLDGTHCYLRWIDPLSVRGARKKAPASVFTWLTAEKWDARQIHADLAYGVSDMRDQLDYVTRDLSSGLDRLKRIAAKTASATAATDLGDETD